MIQNQYDFKDSALELLKQLPNAMKESALKLLIESCDSDLLESIKEEKYHEGYDKGIEEGRDEGWNECLSEANSLLEPLEDVEKKGKGWDTCLGEVFKLLHTLEDVKR
jgi:flagellar biosynthesis/type III secretory pathway protein FliH